MLFNPARMRSLPTFNFLPLISPSKRCVSDVMDTKQTTPSMNKVHRNNIPYFSPFLQKKIKKCYTHISVNNLFIFFTHLLLPTLPLIFLALNLSRVFIVLIR